METINSIMAKEGIENKVELIHAPIVNDGESWHDTAVLDDVFRNVKIDSLIVDGPQSTTGQERYPALPYFFEKLNTDSYAVFLDDASRKGEKEVLKKWSDEFPDLENFSLYGQRIAVSIKNSPYYISPAWHSYNSIQPF